MLPKADVGTGHQDSRIRVVLRPSRTLSRCASIGLVLPQELTLWRPRQWSALEARAAFRRCAALVGQFCAITLSIMSATRKASAGGASSRSISTTSVLSISFTPPGMSALLPEPRDGQVRPQNQLRCEKLKAASLPFALDASDRPPPGVRDPHAGNLDRPAASHYGPGCDFSESVVDKTVQQLECEAMYP